MIYTRIPGLLSLRLKMNNKIEKILAAIMAIVVLGTLAWAGEIIREMFVTQRSANYASSQLVIDMGSHPLGDSQAPCKTELKMYSKTKRVTMLSYDSTFRSVGDAIREELRRMSWHGLKAIEDSSTVTVVTRSGHSDTSATVIRYFTIHR